MSDQNKKSLADQLREKRAAQHKSADEPQTLADKMREQVADNTPQSLAEQLREQAESAVESGAQSLVEHLHENASAGESEAVRDGGLIDTLHHAVEQALEDAKNDEDTKSLAEKMG